MKVSTIVLRTGRWRLIACSNSVAFAKPIAKKDIVNEKRQFLQDVVNELQVSLELYHDDTLTEPTVVNPGARSGRRGPDLVFLEPVIKIKVNVDDSFCYFDLSAEGPGCEPESVTSQVVAPLTAEDAKSEILPVAGNTRAMISSKHSVTIAIAITLALLIIIITTIMISHRGSHDSVEPAL